MTIEARPTPARNIIYALSDPRDGAVRYVGQSRRGLRRAHASAREGAGVREGSAKVAWIQELRAVGLKARVVVLEQCDAAASLNAAEVRWIQHYRDQGAPLCNIAAGGPGARGVCRSAETRAKQSAVAKAHGISPEQRARMVAAKRGKPLSAGHRAKLRAVNLGRKMPADSVERSAAARRGRKMSMEFCEKNRRGHLGQVVTPEHRALISIAQKGRTKSPEWRAKMSALRLAMPDSVRRRRHTDETRAKMSAAKRANDAKRLAHTG